MNASGKSSLMKAIGIAVLLAQVGSYVPATSMTITPFHKIATRILNQDNLWAGLSSFAVEMSELRDIFQVADNMTLVLGDELCSGTESISATAIVAAGIEWLHKCGTRFVLATHLHDLTRLQRITTLPTLRIWHLHVEYDRVRDILVYHRELKSGPGSSMYGLEVARALHLPHEMIEAAFSFRRELTGATPIESATVSSWNSDIVKQFCAHCGTTKNLDAHHIQERHDAINSTRNQDGTGLHHSRNLTVLCKSCHTKHHSGDIHVGSVEDTSEGPKQSIISLKDYEYVPTRKPLFTEEELEILRAAKRADPLLHPKLLVFQIQKEHGLTVTEKQLKSI
jgi:DNA mismatch repair protein MutS